MLKQFQSSCSGFHAASQEAVGSVYVQGVQSLPCLVVCRVGAAA